MTPQELKNAILQLAIQGKLVEQRPEEGTGEDLYRKILATKGTKKEKALPEITEGEFPFDIPESWRWVSIGSVCTNIQYGSSQKSAPAGKVPVLRMGNIQSGRIVYDKLVYTSDDTEIEKYSLVANDLLFNRTNSKELVGKTAIYKGERPAIYAGYLVRITPVLLDADFLNYVMQSQYYWSYCQVVRSDAIGQSNINAEKLKRFIFPLPPLAEQKRIVSKIEELLPLLTRYEQAWTKLEDFNKRFPGDMQKSLLQLAIQGKLVEQRPEAGVAKVPAALNTEKKKARRHGEEFDFPFDIPESWRWTTLGAIAKLINGRAYKQTELLQSGKYAVLRVGNFFSNNSWYYSDLELEPEKYCLSGDLLFAWSASFGPKIWDGEKTIFHYHIWKIDFNHVIDREYLFWWLSWFSINLTNASVFHGTTMRHLTKEGMEHEFIPLPPLAEQKRIVARLEELLPLCERLK